MLVPRRAKAHMTNILLQNYKNYNGYNVSKIHTSHTKHTVLNLFDVCSNYAPFNLQWTHM